MPASDQAFKDEGGGETEDDEARSGGDEFDNLIVLFVSRCRPISERARLISRNFMMNIGDRMLGTRRPTTSCKCRCNVLYTFIG